MKRNAEGFVFLELPELIKMNRLVRGKVDLAGFASWYDSLATDEQVALLYHLHQFAQQAGYDERTWWRAVAEAGQAEDDPLVRRVASFRGGSAPDIGDELEWLSSLDAPERQPLLPLLVYLFGLAEGHRVAGETEESCNHWWHRDLLDERVVAALLADPEFWRTSMKDDRTINRSSSR